MTARVPGLAPSSFGRRGFLASAGLGAAAATPPFGRLARAAEAAGVNPRDLTVVPADKNFEPELIVSLRERGTTTVLATPRGSGLPIGGIACSHIYLSGDAAFGTGMSTTVARRPTSTTSATATRWSWTPRSPSPP
ncbi:MULTISPECIES: hypothetical protein [unclassified Streptomyces]|uniref:hypothetical protein n=1 Tax=unclassified Streptomyces TaxID=2593676 RepID=UPI00225BA00F|nr:MULTISPECIES: hypothetical protein [unclassified Streptomyces]MCX4649409.1 hypothetical protein [Streptomyces sp. NBC_01446]MCX5321392.1 hypothetical protein [Streptomyces sp. NBC_00120]